MKAKNLFIWLFLYVLVGAQLYSLDILTHYSDHEEAGVSFEQNIISTTNLDLGIGVQWNELITDEIRTFPIYFVSRIYTNYDKVYAVLRGGHTLDSNLVYDSKFLESGIGIDMNFYQLEGLVNHSRGQNQFVLKMRYKLL